MLTSLILISCQETQKVNSLLTNSKCQRLKLISHFTGIHRLSHALRWCWHTSRDIFSRTQNTQNTQKRIASLPLTLIAENISFTQAQKAQNYARAALVLAYIAGYFSSTQNTQNTQKRIASLPLFHPEVTYER